MLTSGAEYRRMYGWEAGGMHSTRIFLVTRNDASNDINRKNNECAMLMIQIHLIDLYCYHSVSFNTVGHPDTVVVLLCFTTHT